MATALALVGNLNDDIGLDQTIAAHKRAVVLTPQYRFDMMAARWQLAKIDHWVIGRSDFQAIADDVGMANRNRRRL